MPASTLLLAGGRPALIAPSATPLQYTTAFSLCAADAAAAGAAEVPAGLRARAVTTASVAASPMPILILFT